MHESINSCWQNADSWLKNELFSTWTTTTYELTHSGNGNSISETTLVIFAFDWKAFQLKVTRALRRSILDQKRSSSFKTMKRGYQTTKRKRVSDSCDKQRYLMMLLRSMRKRTIQCTTSCLLLFDCACEICLKMLMWIKMMKQKCLNLLTWLKMLKKCSNLLSDWKCLNKMLKFA
jgi:hypothetical protein